MLQLVPTVLEGEAVVEDAAGVQELLEGVPEMTEIDVPKLAPTALEVVAADEDAAVVQELQEGVPETDEESMPQLATTALKGVAVDDDTAVHALPELPEGEPEMAEEVAELLEEGMPAMVAVEYMPELAEVVVELEEADEELAGSEATGLEVCNKRKTRINTMK